MLVVMQTDATQVRNRPGVRRDHATWDSSRCPCPAGSARPSASSATTAGRRLAHHRRCRGVAQVLHVSKPYKQVSREWKAGEHGRRRSRRGVRRRWQRVVRRSRGRARSNRRSRSSTAARAVRAAGATALRGGAFKPRSSPYAFQGLGKQGLELLALARRETGLPIVTEAMDEAGANLVAEYADCIQIGARNMQNYSLLKVVGPARQAGAAQARHGGDDQRPAAERRVHPGRGQLAGDPVRARRAQLRQRGAQHVRPERDPDRAEAVAPADHRRPESRHRAARQGDANGARGGGGRRGRHHRRGAPATRIGRCPTARSRCTRSSSPSSCAELRLIATAIDRSVAPSPGTAPVAVG